MAPVLSAKNQHAAFEGIKKAACCTTNAILFFYFGGWFSDSSWFPADPVWVHITVTMLCELNSMDKLNEKIILRTAGTTIGAVSGVLMSYSGLSDPMRVLIIFVWIATLSIIEAKDPNRSYTWTIGTVTFGICTYLGRMGKPWTPWKRWFSIILGTLITAVYQLALPMLGLYPAKRVSDELCETSKSIWNNSVAMVEDSIENAQDPNTSERLTQKETSIMGSFRAYPAKWKEYSWSRTWLNLAPKPLPMDVANKLLKAPLLKMFISSSSAARELHRTGVHPCEESYAKVRVEIHSLGLSVAGAMSAICTEKSTPEAQNIAFEELTKAVSSAKNAMNIMPQISIVHGSLIAMLLADMVAVVKGLTEALNVTDAKAKLLLQQCATLSSKLQQASSEPKTCGGEIETAGSEEETKGSEEETSVGDGDTSGSERDAPSKKEE